MTTAYQIARRLQVRPVGNHQIERGAGLPEMGSCVAENGKRGSGTSRADSARYPLPQQFYRKAEKFVEISLYRTHRNGYILDSTVAG